MGTPEDVEDIPTSELLNEVKRRHLVLGRPHARIALLGPPCVGKQTQAEAFRRAFGVCRISADDLAKGASEASSSPDQHAMDRFAWHLDQPQCRRGFVLEGFPKTVPQADDLEKVLQARKQSLDGAIFLEAAEETLMARCEGRLLHEESGRRYHEKLKPPMEDGIDDFTGERLARVTMDDEALKVSIQNHREHSGWLRQFFDRKGLAREVDASAKSEDVAASVAQTVLQLKG